MQKYLVLWAKSSDYDPFHYHFDGTTFPTKPPLLNSMDEVRGYLKDIAKYHPELYAFVYTVTGVSDVKVQWTDPVVTLEPEENP